MQPGRVRRYDYEYQREGTANLFMLCQPLADWREVKTTSRRTKVDFTRYMQELVDVHFPYAEVIRAVLDNLNIDTPAALYDAFAPEEARRLLRKLEFHITPKHGSWLNMAGIEISILSRQCHKQRVSSLDHLAEVSRKWTTACKAQQALVEWCFGQVRIFL